MTNILPFPAKSSKEVATPSCQYRKPTADEAQQIVECLKRMEGHIRTLRGELMSKQGELAAAKRETEQLLSSLICNQENAVSQQNLSSKPVDTEHS